ncbi:MAG: hypothetical protein R6X27_10225, partial [Candidatus Desulfacyla sp.]
MSIQIRRPLPSKGLSSGNLNYKFKGTTTQGNIAQTSSQVNTSQLNISGIGDGLSYNKDNISTADSKPLANVKVSLIVTYVLTGKM